MGGHGAGSVGVAQRGEGVGRLLGRVDVAGGLVALVVLRVVHLVVHSVSDGGAHDLLRTPLAVVGVVEAVFPVVLTLAAPVDDKEAGGAQEERAGAACDAGNGARGEVAVAVATGLGVPRDEIGPISSHVEVPRLLQMPEWEWWMVWLPEPSVARISGHQGCQAPQSTVESSSIAEES